MISISVISHNNGAMVERLIPQLLDCPEVSQLLVTCNLPEQLTLPADSRVMRIDNPAPQGFGANHNAAFRHCTSPFFCPLNPDIELLGNPFPELLRTLAEREGGLVAPQMINRQGEDEDSIRPFPTLEQLLRKAFGRRNPSPAVPDREILYPDWVAGMFMLFRSDDFAGLNGFDEKFYLYYEDVDICARAWATGVKVVANPAVRVVHHAQRKSHSELRYFCWHLASLLRYFRKHSWYSQRARAEAFR